MQPESATGSRILDELTEPVRLEGGPMSAAQAAAFMTLPFAQDAVALRAATRAAS